MSKILKMALGEFLARGWCAEIVEPLQVVRITWKTTRDEWTSYAYMKEDQLFVVYSVCPENVPEERRAVIAEHLTRINWGLPLGNFEMDWDDGEVRFKTSVDLHGKPMTVELMEGVFEANFPTYSRHARFIISVMRGEMSPSRAIEGAREPIQPIFDKLSGPTPNIHRPWPLSE